MSGAGAERLVGTFVVWFLVIASSGDCFTAHAQQASAQVKNGVAPTYPEIARKMGLIGTVRIQLVVALNGGVKETKVTGGHPILVNAALEAVKNGSLKLRRPGYRSRGNSTSTRPRKPTDSI